MPEFHKEPQPVTIVNMVTDIENNPGGRLLAVGDIHGCLQQLQSLISLVEPTEEDQVVFLGDYVDRGPASAGVIDYLIEFRRTFPSTVFLRGNHEQMFSDYLAGRDSAMFLMNGGLQTLTSYEELNKWPIPGNHVEFLNNLLNYFTIDQYIFVHAGLRPGHALTGQDEFDLLWIRKEFLDSDYDWGKTIIYGHTPLQKPYLAENRIGLDTGCVYGRQLTCCDVRSRQIWQV